MDTHPGTVSSRKVDVSESERPMRIRIWNVDKDKPGEEGRILPKKFQSVCANSDHECCGEHYPSEFALDAKLEVFGVRFEEGFGHITIDVRKRQCP